MGYPFARLFPGSWRSVEKVLRQPLFSPLRFSAGVAARWLFCAQRSRLGTFAPSSLGSGHQPRGNPSGGPGILHAFIHFLRRMRSPPFSISPVPIRPFKRLVASRASLWTADFYFRLDVFISSIMRPHKLTDNGPIRFPLVYTALLLFSAPFSPIPGDMRFFLSLFLVSFPRFVFLLRFALADPDLLPPVRYFRLFFSRLLRWRTIEFRDDARG